MRLSATWADGDGEVSSDAVSPDTIGMLATYQNTGIGWPMR